MKPTIDHSGVRAAEKTYSDHLARKAEHTEKIAALHAADAAAAAAKVSSMAIHGAAGDAEAVRDAIRKRTDAAEALDIAQQIGSAMEARAEHLRIEIQKAKSAAHEDLMRHAASEAVGACTDAEAALAAHGMAIARFEAAAVLVREAERGGCKYPADGSHLAPFQPHFTHPPHPAMRKRLRLAADVAADFGKYAP